MNLKEAALIIQHVKDSNEAKGYQVDGSKAKDVYNKFAQADVQVDDVVIKFDLTARGGTIEVRTVKEIKREWEGYGNYLDVRCTEIGILIEPPNYSSKHVEPYNRQSPYYLGTRFTNLDSFELDEWVIRSEKEENKNSIHNVAFPVSPFNYNNYHNSVSGNIVLNAQQTPEFLAEFLEACNLPKNIIEENIRNID